MSHLAEEHDDPSCAGRQVIGVLIGYHSEKVSYVDKMPR
jgi:hypothetical protein